MVWEIKGVNICCKEKKSLLENSEMGGGGGKKRNVGKSPNPQTFHVSKSLLSLGGVFDDALNYILGVEMTDFST